MLAVAGCGGSRKNPTDAKPATDATGTVPITDAGTGGAILTVSPPSVDLGSVDVGKTATAKTVTVTNAGTKASGPITVSVSGTGITATGCSGTTLAVAATCTISITATPAVAGAISGSVSVSEGTSAPKLISVSGMATVPGLFSLTPNSLDLGKTLVRGTLTGKAVMTNEATTGLTGILVTISGTGYTLAPATTCTDSLAVGQTCDIVVSFTSATPGVAIGDVIVSQGGVTKRIALTATVQSPAKLAMTPVTAAFTATIKTASQPVTFYVTNSGDVASGIPTAQLSGTNAADFSISSNSCVTALAGGATGFCQLNVIFTPQVMPATAANETATLTVTDSGAGATSATAALTGTPILPSTLALSGGPDLGIVTVGATGAAVTFTLKNNGDNASGTITVTPSDGQFILVAASDACSGKNLPLKGDSCTFALQFKPAAGTEGVLTGRVTATGSATANPAVLTITGTAVPAAKLVASPTVLEFGSLPTLHESAPQTLTITNVGGVPTGPLVVSNSGAQFTIKGNTCSGAVLTATGATKSCTITVTFTSTGTDVEATGSVSVTDGQTTAGATLHGTGIPPADISMFPSVVCPQYEEDDRLCVASRTEGSPSHGLNPATSLFENKVVGKTSKELRIVVTNYTDPTAAPDSGILTFAITGDAAADFKIVQSNCTAPLVSTSATTSCILTLTATPSAVGLRKALLVLTTSRGGNSQTTLEAKGLAVIEVQPIQVTKTQTGLDFGQVPLGHKGEVSDTPYPYDSLPYRVWVRDTTSADLNTTVTVTLPTPTPADFVWPSTGTSLTITDNPDDPNNIVSPPLDTLSPEGFSGSSVNPCSNKILSLTVGVDGRPVGGTEQGPYTWDEASGYWFCDFPVMFFPQSARGALSADLSAAGSGGGSSKVTLTGNATGPLKITPSPYLLSDPVAVGLASTTYLTLTITNASDESTGVIETGLTFGLSGTGAGDFQIAGTTCWTKDPSLHYVNPAPISYPSVIDQLAPGQSCQVWLGFQPTTQAPYAVTFTVTAANGPGAADDETATDTIQSLGSKTFGPLTITPNPGTGSVFADVPYAFTTAAPVVFTVKNNGTLDATGFNYVLDGSHQDDFLILPAVGVTGACSTTESFVLAGGASCIIRVQAKPDVGTLPDGVGKRLISDTMLVVSAIFGKTSDNPGVTTAVNVPLSYYETSNLMVNDQSSVLFTFAPAGKGTDVPQNFTVSNISSGTVTLAITDADPFIHDEDASVTGTLCKTDTVLAVGGKCTLVIVNPNPTVGIRGLTPPLYTVTVAEKTKSDNQATVLLSSTTMAPSNLVAYGIGPDAGNTSDPTGWSTPDSTGYIDLGTVQFNRLGGNVTLWFQNKGDVATPPLHFRWDTKTPDKLGVVDKGDVDGEFPIIASYTAENTEPCLALDASGNGVTAGGKSVAPMGFCSVTFHFTPKSGLTTGTDPRLRRLWVIDNSMEGEATGSSPSAFVRGVPVQTTSLRVREITATSGTDGFFQFTDKTNIDVPTTLKPHTFEVTNPTTASPIIIGVAALAGAPVGTSSPTWFSISNGPDGNDCLAAPAATTGLTGACRFVVTYTPQETPAQVFEWATVGIEASTPTTVLGLMGRTQQPASLQGIKPATSASCAAVPAGLSGCVDFGTVVVGTSPTQALTVVNMGDVRLTAGLVLTFADATTGATFAQTGTCNGNLLYPYGTAGGTDRCIATVAAHGDSGTVTKATPTAASSATFEAGAGAAVPAAGLPQVKYGVQAEVIKAAALTVSGPSSFEDTAVTGHTEGTFTIYNGVLDPNDPSYQRSGTVGVSVAGAGASQFRLNGSDCAPNLGLASGDSCTATLWFAPTALSPDGNAVTATLNATAAPGTAPAYAIQGMPISALSITSPVLDMTTIPPNFVMDGSGSGTDKVQTFMVTNDAGALQYTSLTAEIKTSISTSDFMLIDDRCYGIMLADGQSCTIDVKYVGAATATAKKATLTINGGTPGQSTAVAISYIGTAATTH